jgi:hypothetical protein
MLSEGFKFMYCSIKDDVGSRKDIEIEIIYVFKVFTSKNINLNSINWNSIYQLEMSLFHIQDGFN